VPSVVHWKAGHYSALVKTEGGRYLSEDPTFGEPIWVTQAALDEETTGYLLIAGTTVPSGWTSVDEAEGGRVWGKGGPPPGDPRDQGSNVQSSGGNSCNCNGMATYRFNTMLSNLNITDIPVGYAPAVGPDAHFRVSYNSKEGSPPATFYYSNLGPNWTFDWLSFIKEASDPSVLPTSAVSLYQGGGGEEAFEGYQASAGTNGSYAPGFKSQSILTRVSTSPIRYQRLLSDGSIETFDQADGPGFPRKVFMTSRQDPAGNTLIFHYDSSLRITSVTDALGQQTTLQYANTADPLKITSVTDPFGRSAVFQYNAAGELASITDVIQMTSSFTYDTGTFISSMTTPYGTTRFTKLDLIDSPGSYAWLQATDPLGGAERLYFIVTPKSPPPGAQHVEVIVGKQPNQKVPPGFEPGNLSLDTSLSVFFDKRAMAQPGGNDFAMATITTWLVAQDQYTVTSTKHTETRPLENPVWYAYPGQPNPVQPDEASVLMSVVGVSNRPSQVSRVLDDRTTPQLAEDEYNSLGKITRHTDALGRTTVYSYYPNGIDPQTVQRVNGQQLQTIRSFGTYNALHEPQSVTDALGNTTSYGYDSRGRVSTVETPARNGPNGPLTDAQRTTTYAYYPDNDPVVGEAGRLQSITGPQSDGGQAVTSYTYDGFGRVFTVKDPAGLVRTYTYDALDRVTQVAYPDNTTEQTGYNRLDAQDFKDRLGHRTHTFHDSLRQAVAVQDAAGGTTTYQWCVCGSLDSLTDANQNTTSWLYDIEGRKTQETRADKTFTKYSYEQTTSRLHQQTDRKGVTTTYTCERRSRAAEL
jgi:YD repeat-containing protein